MRRYIAGSRLALPWSSQSGRSKIGLRKPVTPTNRSYYEAVLAPLGAVNFHAQLSNPERILGPPRCAKEEFRLHAHERRFERLGPK